MKRLFSILTMHALGLTLACADRSADDGQPAVCEPACTPFGADFPGVGECVDGSCSPTFFECFESGEYSTCTAQCEAVGSTCVEDGCAGGTYMIQSSLEQCLDPEAIGVAVSRGCDDDIEWFGNTGARCCCEQNP